MIRIIILFTALLAVSPAPAQQPLRQERGNLILEGVAARDAAFSERVDRYLNSRRAVFLDWLPDGGMLVATRFGDTEQVHRVTEPLGMREQLTFFADPVGAARVPQIADAEGFVFLKNQGGDENAQIYYYRNADRSVRLLTDGKSLHGSPVWSHDGKRFAFFGNGRDGIGHDIYVLEIAGNTPPRLVVGAQKDIWYPLDWSADDQKLLVQRYVSANRSYLYIVDAWSGILTPLDTSDREIGIRAAKFAPGGRGVIIASDEGGEFAQLSYFDPTTHESRKLTADSNWDVTAFDISADGRYLAYVRNEDGRSRLAVLDNQTKLELTPPNVPDGRIGELRFDPAGKRLAFSAESAQSPRDVYVYEPASNTATRWTRSEAGPLDSNTFITPELVHYPTWDRRMLSAYVYRPRAAGPHPVLIYIHSEPEDQYQPGFEPFFQYLVNELGFAVIAPNVRGSAGYGKSFLKLDDSLSREDSVKDIGSLLVWIGVQSAFDRERVAVMGGYSALASLADYGDRLCGAVDLVDDSRRLPFNKLSAIGKPLFVVQGLNDPRVPAAESEQMIAVLRSKGREVSYLAAKDLGLGFKQKANRDVYFETVAAFLERLGRPNTRAISKPPS